LFSSVVSILTPYRVHGNEPIPEVVDYFTKGFSAKLDIFDKILAKQKFMGGEQFSLIDIFCIPYTHYMFQSGDGGLITDRPHLKAWWKSVSERPTVKELLAAAQMPKV
jgi:glutathione S-transferase